MATERENILARLRRVEGQVRGIQRMIEEERECEEIVTQLMAARAALDRAGLLIMTEYIDECLLDPASRPNRARLERIMSFFLKVSGSVPPMQDGGQSVAAAGDSETGAATI